MGGVERRRTRIRLGVVLGVFVFTLLASVGLVQAYTRTFTHIACTYHVSTYTSGGYPVSETRKGSSGCYSGTNVGVQSRWRVTGCPTTWSYSPQISSQDIVQIILSGPVCFHQTSGRRRNAYPDSWSGWSTFG